MKSLPVAPPVVQSTRILVHINVYEKIHSILNGDTSADRVTALINAFGGGYLKADSRALGSPGVAYGKYLFVNGTFSEIDVCLLRAVLKHIANRSKSVYFGGESGSGVRLALPLPDVHSPAAAQEKIEGFFPSYVRSLFHSITRISKKIFGCADNFFAKKKPARIIWRVTLYGFAFFGLLSLISVVWVGMKVNSAIAASSSLHAGNINSKLEPAQTALPAGGGSATGIFSASENMGSIDTGSVAHPVEPEPTQKPTVSPPREVEIVTGHADMPSHRFYVFSDPLCPFCKRFEPVLEQVASMKGMEMHLFPTPLHDGSIGLVNKIACAANRGAAWSQSITTETAPDCASGKQETAMTSLHASQFFQSLHLEGTPTVINEAGLVHPGGFASAAEMTDFLNKK